MENKKTVVCTLLDPGKKLKAETHIKTKCKILYEEISEADSGNIQKN
jgi:hypothetical protein